MNTKFFRTFPFLVLAILTLVSACSSVPRQLEWQFIEEQGGLSISPLSLIDGIYYLPVHMSLAGYKPGTRHERVCARSVVRVAGKQLMLKIYTDLKKNQPKASAECPIAKVGGIPDGFYRVVYLGPKGEQQKLGDVRANLFGD